MAKRKLSKLGKFGFGAKGALPYVARAGEQITGEFVRRGEKAHEKAERERKDKELEDIMEAARVKGEEEIPFEGDVESELFKEQDVSITKEEPTELPEGDVLEEETIAPVAKGKGAPLKRRERLTGKKLSAAQKKREQVSMQEQARLLSGKSEFLKHPVLQRMTPFGEQALAGARGTEQKTEEAKEMFPIKKETAEQELAEAKALQDFKVEAVSLSNQLAKGQISQQEFDLAFDKSYEGIKRGIGRATIIEKITGAKATAAGIGEMKEDDIQKAYKMHAGLVQEQLEKASGPERRGIQQQSRFLSSAFFKYNQLRTSNNDVAAHRKVVEWLEEKSKADPNAGVIADIIEDIGAGGMTEPGAEGISERKTELVGGEEGFGKIKEEAAGLEKEPVSEYESFEAE